MHVELDVIKVNNTWVIMTLPPNKIIIGCRWIFKIQYNSDGFIDRYKARLVAKDHNQLEGLHFLDTFSLVAKLTTVRLLLAIASSQCWSLKQLNISNAFLQNELYEDVYTKVSHGLKPSSPNQVCKLQHSLYDLKKAGRQ